ncbi:MAG: IS21-like element helper ATPase IstB [Prolixibacteraceae bacterium]|nr:IS21-like element helper ATPase IstB [Prolixibacteraceae bacterium]
MSQNQTITKLNQMKLYGMARAYEMLHTSRQSASMTEDELLCHIVEAEWDDKQNQKLHRLIKSAKFRYQACIEEIAFTQDRNLDKSSLLRLAGCDYLEKKENIIITGATGVGKSHIASALGNEACIKGYKTIYCNVSKLLSLLKMKRSDGTYLREIEKLERQDLLILDDFGLAQLDTQNRLDLLEIIEDRHGKKSTIITSQLPLTKWHDVIADSTIADAILDRLVHNAHRIELKGDSLRKKK